MNVRLVAGRYRLERELGRGGMGTVWLAEDQLAGRQVAVKELRPPQGLSDAEQETFARRARQEARSAARIQHANAVTLFDVIPATADDNAVYLVMEYIQGQTLADVIAAYGTLSDDNAKAVGLHLLAILEVAHGLGIVHRDIKPSNIMITADGQAKLTDFGIAYNIGDTRLTSGGVIGTQAYMAPELFESAPITPAIDLWSLGATLYYSIEGRGPFDRENTAATLHAILIADLPDPHCGPDLAFVIRGLLARDPARRLTVAQARAALLGDFSAFPGEPQAPAPQAQPISPAYAAQPYAAQPYAPVPYGSPQYGSPPPEAAVPESASPAADKTPGARRVAAAALLGLAVVLNVTGMFLPVYGKTALTGDSRWLWPSVLYAVSWAAVAGWLLAPRVRSRPWALFALALGGPATGLALQELAEVTSLYPAPGSGFIVGLISVLAGLAGAVCALTIPEVRPAADPPDSAGSNGGALDSDSTPGWLKALPPAVGLAAIVVYSAFPWLQGVQSVFATFGLSAWEGPGAIIPVLVLAAIVVASVRSRRAGERGALLAGAAVYLAAIALQDLVTAAQFQFRESLTPVFWVYLVLTVAVGAACAWTLGSPRRRHRKEADRRSLLALL